MTPSKFPNSSQEETRGKARQAGQAAGNKARLGQSLVGAGSGADQK